MKQAVTFDDFRYCCPYFNNRTADGYGCDHPSQEAEDVFDGKEEKQCCCWSCPLGVEAEQEDKDNPEYSNDVDWDGLCEHDEVIEGEYLLVEVGDDATDDEKDALFLYERYVHRYDKEWLDAHNISNSLAE